MDELGRLVRSKFSDGTPERPAPHQFPVVKAGSDRDRSRIGWRLVDYATIVRGMRPAQWLKNGVVFAGLVFGGKLLEPAAVMSALLAAIWFCLLSSGFYFVNDVRDRHADRLHPDKRLRPVAAGAISPAAGLALGAGLIAAALLGGATSGLAFLSIAVSYGALMVAYNLGLKHVVILDVFAIAVGFVLRAVGGAIAVDVSISPWLLVCTMLLALLLGFGKRRHELLTLDAGPQHRANLETYGERFLDQAVAVSATGALLSYAVYSVDGQSPASSHRMLVTIPIVAYGVFRYLYLIYGRGQGGAPETLLLTDRSLLGAVVTWSLASVILFYLAG